MTKTVKKLVALFVALFMLTTLFGGCSTNTQTPAQASAKPLYKELTVYTALPEVEIPIYFNAFEKDTGIKVNYIRLSSGEVLARLQAEKNNPNASVFHGGSTDNFIQAIGQGLLEKYTSPESKNVPEEYLDKEGYWTPFYIGAISFACNKDWFTKNKLKYPESWDDLLKPEFKGQVSMAHPSTSGTSYTVLATLVQLMGEEKAFEYMKKLNSSVRQYTKSGAAPPMEVGLGEAAIALTFAHDGLKPVGEGYPIELSFPKDGTGYEIGGLSIIKGGPEKEKDNAKAFIDWCVSKAGQELFDVAKSYRVPLNKAATPPKGAIKIADLKTIKYDAQWAGDNRKRLIERFTSEIESGKNLKQ